MAINTTVFGGNLTRDPEIKEFGQSKVANFTLANTRKYRAADDEQKEETTFLDVEVWGKTVDIVEKYLHKGNQTIVEGSLKQDTWEDKDGNKRSKIKLRADKVHLIGGREKGEEATPQATAPSRPAPAASGAADDQPPFSRSEHEVY